MQRISRGNWPRFRKHSSKTLVRGKPIAGLPENFYDSAWLERLAETQRQDLDIRPSIDLSISENTLRCVSPSVSTYYANEGLLVWLRDKCALRVATEAHCLPMTTHYRA